MSTMAEPAVTMALTASAAEKLTARLDRLPMTRTLWIMALLICFGGFFDSYALAMIGALGPGLIRAKILTATTVSFFGMTGLASFIAALFAGLFVGSLVFSHVADRFGRRTIFAYAMVWYGIADIIMGFQTTADGLNLWRFISAIGLGVDLVTVDTYLSELVPKRARGKSFAFLQLLVVASGPVIYFLSWQLVPIEPFGVDGWRWVVWIGALSAILIWFIRLGLPESPRWLAQQGRIEEAERVMAGIEARVEAESGRPLPPPDLPQAQVQRKGSVLEVFSPQYRVRTIMLMLFNFFQTVGFYGFFGWVPTLLIEKGIHITQSLEYTFIINIASLSWPLILMLFADRIERKWQVCLSCFSIAVIGITFGQQDAIPALIVLGALMSMSGSWMAYSLHNYQSELYPTRIRARAVGFVYSWSRLSGVFTGFMVAFFLRHFGVPGVFLFIAACMAVVIISVAWLGPRTNNLELEAIAH